MAYQSLLINPVTYQSVTFANVRGTKSPAYFSTDTNASVQPMKASRRILHVLVVGDVGYTIYFDPDQFPGIAQGKVDDLVTTQYGVLQVLGPSRDEAGRGRVWAVDAKLIK
jgi:hypothetical protein